MPYVKKQQQPKYKCQSSSALDLNKVSISTAIPKDAVQWMHM